MNARPRRSRCSRIKLVARDRLRQRRQRAWIGALLLVILAGGASLGFALNQPGAGNQVGLQGIWPGFPPRSLSVDQFSKLDQRWADWSQQAAIDASNIYNLAGRSVEEQYELLAALEQRVSVLETALNDPDYAVIRDKLTDLYASLKLRTDLFRALLDLVTAEAAPAAEEALPQARGALKNAISRVRADLRSVPDGYAWLPYLELDELEQALGSESAAEHFPGLLGRLDPNADDLSDDQAAFLERSSLRELAAAAGHYASLLEISQTGIDREELAPVLSGLIEAVGYHDGSPTDRSAARIRAAIDKLRRVAGPAAEPLIEVIRRHYLNYNLRLVADASFLSKLTSATDVTSGPVRDRFMGANIYGSQRTRTHVGFEIIPSTGRARFQIVLDGVARSRTTAYAEKATVSSRSRNCFHAVKPLSFNGERFFWDPARVSVDPNIRHTGISTKFDHIFFGLFKGMIRRRAMEEANSRKPQSRAHAAAELRAKLLPRFNSEVARNFRQLNRELGQLQAELAEENLAPSAERLRTTSESFLYDVAVRGGEELSGSAPNIGSTRGVGFTLQVHESALNNAADRWNLAGRSLTEKEVRGLLADWLSDLLGMEITFEKPAGEPADPSVIHFAESNPIRFNIGDGAVTLIIRAGVKTAEGKTVPPQVVSVPLTISIEKGTIHINRGTVRVNPLEPPRNRARQFTRAGIMRKQIQQSIQEGTQDATFLIQRQDRPAVQVTIERIDAQAGWLTIYGR